MADKVQELQDQVAELQAQLAFQEETVRDLDDALAAQQKELLWLRRQIELLQSRHEEFVAQRGEPESLSIVDEKPPHY